MSNLSYNGQVIEQRQSDNYVNLTQMAQANDVELKHFNDSEFAKNYLKALQESESRDSRLTVNGQFIFTESVGFPAVKTTWGHPLVAIAFGQWISPEFHVWCNVHIKTLMSEGTVSIRPLFYRIETQDNLELRLQVIHAETQKMILEKVIEDGKHPQAAIYPLPSEIIDDSATISKFELCLRYGILRFNCVPDVFWLDYMLESVGGLRKELWKTVARHEKPYGKQTYEWEYVQEFRREHLAWLDAEILAIPNGGRDVIPAWYLEKLIKEERTAQFYKLPKELRRDLY